MNSRSKANKLFDQNKKKMYRQFHRDLLNQVLHGQTTSPQIHLKSCIYCKNKRKRCRLCHGRGWIRI